MQPPNINIEQITADQLSFDLLAEIARTNQSLTDMFISERKYMRVLANREWYALTNIKPQKAHIARLIEEGKSIASMLNPDADREGKDDFVVTIPRANNTPLLFRGHAASDRYGKTLSLRVLNQVPLTMAELGFNSVDFTKLVGESKYTGGLVLVCGPTSSGKSTTMAAMVEEYCANVRGRVVTLEDPIEYPFDQEHHFVTQREIGRDVRTWEEGIFGALRERIDLLVIGELRTADSIRAALQASSTGMFVIATVHVMRIKELMERLVLEFPSEEQDNIRKKLASSLQLVVCQRLLPGNDHAILLHEMLTMNTKARTAFTKGTPQDIDEIISAGGTGIISFKNHLHQLKEQNQISQEVFDEWNKPNLIQG
jgi:twitching motility protein PilT